MLSAPPQGKSPKPAKAVKAAEPPKAAEAAKEEKVKVCGAEMYLER